MTVISLTRDTSPPWTPSLLHLFTSSSIVPYEQHSPHSEWTYVVIRYFIFDTETTSPAMSVSQLFHGMCIYIYIEMFWQFYLIRVILNTYSLKTLKYPH